MKLPNAKNAVVDREKIVNYLLNAAHPDNGGKAAFFFGLGFRRDDWKLLAISLQKLAETSAVIKNVESPHGRKYILRGNIETPSGKTPLVQTVWIIDRDKDAPRLVTGYPQD
jgi:hypothetical protein